LGLAQGSSADVDSNLLASALCQDTGASTESCGVNLMQRRALAKGSVAHETPGVNSIWSDIQGFVKDALKNDTTLDPGVARIMRAVKGATSKVSDDGEICIDLRALVPDCEDALQWDFNQAEVIENNLAGNGPNKSDPEYIRYTLVTSAKNSPTNAPIDLLVTSSKSYVNPSPEKNGLNGKFGSITQQCSTSQDYTFQFVKSGTTTPFGPIPHLMFSIFDSDHGSGWNQGLAEITTVKCGSGLVGYKTSSNNELIDRKAGGSPQFQSTTVGSMADNPSDPTRLTDLQKARSVTFDFKNTDTFTLNFNISTGIRTRSFLFGGFADFACLEGEDPSGQTVTMKQACGPGR